MRGVSALALLLFGAATAYAEEERCNCTCAFNHKKQRHVVTELTDVTCGQCDSLCAPYVQAAIAEIKKGRARPPAKTAEEIQAIRDSLSSFLTPERQPDLTCKGQPKGECSCPDRSGRAVCGPCRGLCYSQKEGVDCSHIVLKANPGLAAAEKVSDCSAVSDKDCEGLAQRQLQFLIAAGQDNIDSPEKVRDGDIAFFAKSGVVDHVVQIVGDPKCAGDQCSLEIIAAPAYGRPVEKKTVTLRKEEDGRYCYRGTQQCFYRAGSSRP